MIYDCFTFFNELDLLEIRLNVLNDVVDKFVLVESKKNFKNQEKPLFFEENKSRYAKFADKIIHIVVDKMPENMEIKQWTIENYQRNQILRGLDNCSDDDIIMISDLDEIPRPEMIKTNFNKDKIVAFDMDVFTYFLNNYTVYYRWTHGTKMLSYKNLKSILDDYDSSNVYGIEADLNKGTTPNTVRLYYGEKQIHLKKAGWHFSYIGNQNFILNKYRSSIEGNSALSIEDCQKIINSKKFMDEYYLVPIEIDNSFPKYLQENIEKYKHVILPYSQKMYSNIYSIGFRLKYCLLYFLDNVFSIKTQIKNDIKHRKITILGVKISYKVK